MLSYQAVRASRRTLKSLLLSALFISPMAMAAYPEKPIQLIVPWAAGGGSDAAARGIAAALEQELGVTINVVNRAGGNGVVGHSVMTTAKPDGYTLGFITGELNMMHWQGLTKLTYKDFTPIAMTNYDYPGVQVAADAPYNSVDELLDTIRNEPKGTIKASGTGLGGIWHVAFSGCWNRASTRRRSPSCRARAPHRPWSNWPPAASSWCRPRYRKPAR
jgi:tripartite-type tricarboxylate transporter receptor subunit TctC